MTKFEFEVDGITYRRHEGSRVQYMFTLKGGLGQTGPATWSWGPWWEWEADRKICEKCWLTGWLLECACFALRRNPQIFDDEVKYH